MGETDSSAKPSHPQDDHRNVAPADEPTVPAQKKLRAMQRYKTAALVVVQLVLITVVFLQVNYLSCRKHVTRDLTDNQRFTLSDTSANFLRGMSSDVHLVMAFLTSSELYQEVRGLLAEYSRIGGDSLTVEYLDLSRSRTRLAELRDKHQLEFSRDQIVILGDSGRIKTISAEELVRRDVGSGRVLEFRGEEVLTSSLLEVTEQQQKKIYMVSGGRRADELIQIAAQLQPLVAAQNARMEALVLEGRQDLPADASVIFFPGHAQDLTEREVELLRHYWEERRGGLVFFLDPTASTPNLRAMLRELGVSPNEDRVLSVVSALGMAARRTYDVPVAMMPGDGPTRELPALSTRLMGQTQSLEVLYEDDLLISENIHPRPLMIAGSGFWGETEYQASEVTYNPDSDNGPPNPVFTAASVEKGVPGDANLLQGTSRLVVVGNANLIAPDGNTSKVAADFTMASFNWVMNRESLMGISPRRPTAFTLNISAADFGLLQSITIFLLPLSAILAAAWVWFRRRA